jgi:two-component system nitrogen regulation response regulator NtrX
MARLRERIEALARESRSVWFHGEGGSGKELAARTLHARSGRAASRFALCSCAGLDASNWSERLGLDETDDPRDDGFLARAAGGSLYLEDVPRLARDLQSRLRDLLERPAVRTLDLRVLGSSGTDPDTLVEQGRVVESLRAHLGHETVSLPPLRERTEDIPLLARHFVRTIAAINELPPIRVAPGALHLLERYRWPENVQELRDALERAVILSTDGTIRPDDLPPRVREAVSSAAAMPASEELPLRPFRDAKRDIVESFERGYLQTLMERHRGNVTAASRRAGMLRSALQRLLRKHGLKSETFRRQGVAQKGGESTRPVP